ncbi:MAG: phasin family protein [Intestinibacillus sp.]
MFAELGNDLRKILLAGIGAVAVTAEKSEEVVKELVKRGELTIEQGKALNEELKHKIKETVQEKRAEFSASMASVNVEAMSREEREDLKRKLAELDAKEQHVTDRAEE